MKISRPRKLLSWLAPDVQTPDELRASLLKSDNKPHYKDAVLIEMAQDWHFDMARVALDFASPTGIREALGALWRTTHTIVTVDEQDQLGAFAKDMLAKLGSQEIEQKGVLAISCQNNLPQYVQMVMTHLDHGSQHDWQSGICYAIENNKSNLLDLFLPMATPQTLEEALIQSLRRRQEIGIFYGVRKEYLREILNTLNESGYVLAQPQTLLKHGLGSFCEDEDLLMTILAHCDQKDVTEALSANSVFANTRDQEGLDLARSILSVAWAMEEKRRIEEEIEESVGQKPFGMTHKTPRKI